MQTRKEIAESFFSNFKTNKLVDQNLLIPKRPLIFVPGIRTCRLAIRKEDGALDHFWPLMPHEFLLPSRVDRVFQHLDTKIRLEADDDVPIIPTGLVPFMYDGLIKSILARGYRPNSDFWIFPYDWRQSNKVSGKLLATFIEEKVSDKRDGADIISHSMGGIITRAAYTYGAPIRRTIYIACPHLGSPLAYFILHPQIDSSRFIASAYHNLSGIPPEPEDVNNAFHRRKTLYQRRKELFVKFPSMYELLPDESYFASRAMLLADGNQTMGPEDTYLKNDWAFRDEDMRNHVRDAISFKKQLGEGLPEQDVLNICGINQPTCDAINYSTYYHASVTERKSVYLMQQGFSLPYDSGQHGDGYVPILSSMALASEAMQHQRSFVQISATHGSLPNLEATTDAIGRFLTS